MNETLIFVLSCVYFILPAGIANLTPVLVKKINFLNYPMDLGKKFRGKRVFGSHKTFRGLFFGVLAGILFSFMQFQLYSHQSFQIITIVNFNQVNWFLLGLLMASGALIGDAIKSFFKRQINVSPGKSWVPFDQLDWVIGLLLFTSIIFIPRVNVIIFLLIVMPFLHVIVNLLGYYLGIKKNKL